MLNGKEFAQNANLVFLQMTIASYFKIFIWLYFITSFNETFKEVLN